MKDFKRSWQGLGDDFISKVPVDKCEVWVCAPRPCKKLGMVAHMPVTPVLQGRKQEDLWGAVDYQLSSGFSKRPCVIKLRQRATEQDTWAHVHTPVQAYEGRQELTPDTSFGVLAQLWSAFFHLCCYRATYFPHPWLRPHACRDVLLCVMCDLNFLLLLIYNFALCAHIHTWLLGGWRGSPLPAYMTQVVLSCATCTFCLLLHLC